MRKYSRSIKQHTGITSQNGFFLSVSKFPMISIPVCSICVSREADLSPVIPWWNHPNQTLVEYSIYSFWGPMIGYVWNWGEVIMNYYHPFVGWDHCFSWLVATLFLIQNTILFMAESLWVSPWFLVKSSCCLVKLLNQHSELGWNGWHQHSFLA